MVVGKLYVVSLSILEHEADAPCLVYANTILSFAVFLKPLKAVVRRYPKIAEVSCGINHFEFSLRCSEYIWW